MKHKITDWKIREVPVVFLLLVGAFVLFVFGMALTTRKAYAAVDSILNSIITLALTIPAIVLPIPLTSKNGPEAKKSLKNILYWVLGFCSLAVVKYLLDVLKNTNFFSGVFAFLSVILAASTIICYLFILMFSLGYIKKYLSSNS